jgi:hypothetical protein
MNHLFGAEPNLLATLPDIAGSGLGLGLASLPTLRCTPQQRFESGHHTTPLHSNGDTQKHVIHLIRRSLTYPYTLI